MAGALPEAELVDLLPRLGFVEVRITERFQTFAGTTAEVKLAEDLRVGGVNLFAARPR